MKKALVVLSGGLDSTVCASIASKNYNKVYSLVYNYGQRHSKEIENAIKVSEHYGIEYKVIDLSFMNQLSTNALTNTDVELKKDGIIDDLIPSTFVAGRNLIFLSIATAFAYNNDISDIFIGVNAIDYSGYPDCRPEFISKAESAINAAIEGAKKLKINILTPLLYLNKKEVVELGIANNAPLKLTTSCYNGKAKACGKCDSCVLRLKGFREAGISDPIEYENESE
jgi:7-cyano-7-deazaguanine synthase